MRKLKFFWIFVLLIAFIAVVAVAADEVPTPPYYGVWLLRDGSMTEIPALTCTQVGSYRGITADTRAAAIHLRKGDRIFYFFASSPGNLFITPISNDLREFGGRPMQGGMYEVNLYLPLKSKNGDILETIKISPAMVVNGVIMHELLFPLFPKVINVLHGGDLTSNYISPSNKVYLFEF